MRTFRKYLKNKKNIMFYKVVFYKRNNKILGVLIDGN